MSDSNDFGPIETPADKWRNAFIGLVVLALIVVAARYGWIGG